MKKAMSYTAAMIVSLFIASTASAIEFRTERFALDGTGSFMDSPPIFAGDIIAGTLAPGTFWFKFDDTGWPTDDVGTPGNERLDYIIDHYFVYDDVAKGWDGEFPPLASGEPAPLWRFYTSAGDTLGGLCPRFLITFTDIDEDGVVDPSDWATKVMSTNLIAYINFGGGCFENWCGQGSLHGDLNVIDQETLGESFYVPSVTSASGRLDLRDGNCTTGIEHSSWGKIKSFYR